MTGHWMARLKEQCTQNCCSRLESGGSQGLFGSGVEWGDRACTGDVVARDESPLFFILVRSPDRLDIDRTNVEMSFGEFDLWLA